MKCDWCGQLIDSKDDEIRWVFSVTNRWDKLTQIEKTMHGKCFSKVAKLHQWMPISPVVFMEMEEWFRRLIREEIKGRS